MLMQAALLTPYLAIASSLTIAAVVVMVCLSHSPRVAARDESLRGLAVVRAKGRRAK